MAFRADEAARTRYEDAVRYLIPRSINTNAQQATRSRNRLAEIVEEIGPVVDAYPSWHPLVSSHSPEHRELARLPSRESGYSGLDHTVFFANGFITCPYRDSQRGQRVFDSVAALPNQNVATITAESLDVQFYSPDAQPILVKCEWGLELEGSMIPLAIAMPLFLEKEVPTWRSSQVAETWETMRPYILGSPYGRRSSLFVGQETGQAMKKVWEALISSGMFGPVYQ
ncbi:MULTISPECIES: hypothetical protein [Pseudomonas]|uniref:hypothetical protein n=1 Tax=Pseudomonas TaxID=286 RepID=UPI00168B5D36|nr:hypothetical protein [Pseudomonas putida]QNL86153.1 Uncharacterized protein PPKH_0739 [Pseudomonas putida]